MQLLQKRKDYAVKQIREELMANLSFPLALANKGGGGGRLLQRSKQHSKKHGDSTQHRSCNTSTPCEHCQHQPHRQQQLAAMATLA